MNSLKKIQNINIKSKILRKTRNISQDSLMLENEYKNNKHDNNYYNNTNLLNKKKVDISSLINATRKNHIISILTNYDKEHLDYGKNISLDLFLKKYFISHKSISLVDRSFIYEQVYYLMRNKLFLDVICSKKSKTSWVNRFESYYNKSYFLSQKENVKLPFNLRESFPKELFTLLNSNYNYNHEKTESIIKVLNERAPLTIRVNLIKCSREELLILLKKEGFDVYPTEYSPIGITFKSKPKMNFFSLDLFKKGFFEIQDEGSQLVSLRIKTKPGDCVLDYCGGSAGKTLAFAPYMQNKGQIFVHDIRKNILLEAKRRLRRANIQNYQLADNKNKLLFSMKNKFDWVLLDVPCSGTGTLRRNPEFKYKFNLDKFEELRKVQLEILEESLLFVKPKGKIVYTTCSLLHEENLSQVVKFCSKHNYSIEDDNVFETLPISNGMDGFFSATLIKNN